MTVPRTTGSCLRSALTGLLSAGLLAACAQPVPTGSIAVACSASQPSAAKEIRVQVRFRQTVDGASPELLQRLRQQTGACATYSGSVSPTVHAYSFTGVGDGERLRQNLLSWPAVLDVVPDQKVPPPGLR